MERFELDVLICGSSRPQLLIYLLESLERFIVSQSKNTDFRLLMHEDFVQPEKSKETVELAREWGAKVIAHNPPIGYGPAMKLMLDNHIKTEYMLNLQDDWEFERTGIDIDRILWTMDKHSKINCITFNKRKNDQAGHIVPNGQYKYDGLLLSLSKAWHVLPGVWRVSVARNKWVPAQSNPAGAFIKEFGGVTDNKKFLEEHVGAYFYGPAGDERWVRHLGHTWKTTPWGKNNPKLEADISAITKWRPKWLPLEARPTNKKVTIKPHNEEHFLKLLEQMPEDVKKEYKR